MKTSLVKLILLFLLLTKVVFAERIKDIAMLEGAKENQLIGYGIVVGLDGTGDKGNVAVIGIVNMLKKMGINLAVNDIKQKDSAAVMITATLPPFPKTGMKIDAVVSVIGDAKSLQGGTLLLAPMKGADGNIYGLAQGPISIGGFVGGSGGNTTQKNHTTVGRIPEGIILEKTPAFELPVTNEYKFFLKKPDLTNAINMTKKINKNMSGDYAKVIDHSTVIVKVPDKFADNPFEFLSIVENLDVDLDRPAKVVINERTGTVIIGEKVKISPVAISHGNLTIEIKTEYAVSQPAPFAPKSAETVVLPEKTVKTKEEKASLIEISGVTLGEVVKALNSLGVTPRDLISILQALKASGALNADLEIL